jgi:adenosylcobinamide-phosphate synthase
MNLVPSTVLVIAAAWALDMIFGDPERLPHPVRWMGAAIAWSESRFRGIALDLRVSGALMSTGLILLSWAAAAGAAAAAGWFSTAAGAVVEALILFACISTRSLATEAEEMMRVLQAGGIDAARVRLGRIVGRDTDGLSRRQMARATVETVAENLVDGIVAPLFFAAIGGAPLAAAYRMINTLDAMIGHRSPRYRAFGAFAARVDDAANWVPARISVPLIGVAAQILCRRGRAAFSTAAAEGRRHTSPNAGFSEAAFAGALEVSLGGPSRYGGVTVPKPWIGARFGPARIADIRRARDLMVLSSALCLVLMVAAAGVSALFW